MLEVSTTKNIQCRNISNNKHENFGLQTIGVDDHYEEQCPIYFLIVQSQLILSFLVKLSFFIDLIKTFDCFIGPNALWDQRCPSREFIGDIGEGDASKLRSLDVGYLTR